MVKVLITREKSQAKEMAELLKERGWEPITVSAIQFQPLWNSEIKKVLRRLYSFDWLIFTSANGVKFFKNAMVKAQVDWRRVKAKICAIGEVTAGSLRELGIVPDIIPSRYIAEGITEVFKRKKIRRKKILIPRAEIAREVLPESLREMGAYVKVLPVYRTISPRNLKKNLMAHIDDVDIITFTSPSTVRNVMRYPEVRKGIQNLPVAVIGPITASELRKYGLKPAVVSKKFTVHALIKEIEKFLKK